MKIIVKNVIGKSEYTFEIEERDVMECFSQAAFFGHHFETCGLCKSPNIHLDGSKAKGFTFIKVICGDCNARRQMGQYKDGGFFWKAWEKYQPPVATDNTPPPEY